MSPGLQSVEATASDDVPESDEALMSRYAAGDAGAFDELYSRHRARLFRYLLHQVRSQALAEELFQDIWMKLIGARERYVATARFSTFLLTLAHHRVIDHFRRAQPVETEIDESTLVPHIDAPSMDVPDPARLAEQNQALRRVDAALATLAPEQREIFLLREESDLSLEELAEVTGVSRETAKSRLRYAVAHLRRILADAP